MIPRLVALVTARTLVALVPVVDAVVLMFGAPPQRGALDMGGTRFEYSSSPNWASTPDPVGAPPRGVSFRDLLPAYRMARTLRRCTRLLNRVDRAIDREDRATAERLMERVRVVMAGVAT